MGEFLTEPERVRHITRGLFGRQSDHWTRLLTNGTRISLRGGADRADDAAWLSLSGPMTLVASSDYVRGVGFALYENGNLSYYDLGYYLVGANFSDIAAMGASPIAFLSVVRYSPCLSDVDFELIMQGIYDACEAIEALNVGGDIGTADKVTLSGTAIGSTSGPVLTRSGAKVGDFLMLGGDTGVAAACQQYFHSSMKSTGALKPSQEDELLDRWRRVSPQVSLGQTLLEEGLASSCQDTSDGLRATIESISTQSNVGFIVDADLVPVNSLVEEVARYSGESTPLDLVFGPSVDFRLLFTIPPIEELASALEKRFSTVTRIGVATHRRDCLLRTPRGRLAQLPGMIWDHSSRVEKLW